MIWFVYVFDRAQHIYEHLQDFGLGDIPNALISHNLEIKQSFKFKDSKVFVKIHFKQHRNVIESCIVSNYYTIKQRSSFFKLSPTFVKLVLSNYNIPYSNQILSIHSKL